jgi:hypothetical protein
MPEHLARFRVEDWCDPTAEPPEWWTWANASKQHWSLASDPPAPPETYWWLHARMQHMRAVRAWKDAAASPVS